MQLGAAVALVLALVLASYALLSSDKPTAAAPAAPSVALPTASAAPGPAPPVAAPTPTGIPLDSLPVEAKKPPPPKPRGPVYKKPKRDYGL